MSIIALLFTLLIFGVILWAVNTLIPMDEKVKAIINVVAIIAILVWLGQSFGLLGGSPLRLR